MRLRQFKTFTLKNKKKTTMYVFETFTPEQRETKLIKDVPRRLQWGSAVPGEEAWENAERCKSLKSTVART